MHKSINDDNFRVADPTYAFRGGQLVHKAGEIPLVIDVTVFNAIIPAIKNKREKPSTGMKAQSREVSKSAKYQDLYHAVG